MPRRLLAFGNELGRFRQSSLASLKSTRGFIALYKQGKWVHGPSLSLGWLLKAEGQAHIGIRTRKGLKGAVIRNRLKRQMRAVIKEANLVPRQSVDVVLVLHPHAGHIATQDLKKEACQLFQTARLL